ncbi:DUF418 domain-containing protein [Lewinella sp. LCG006]|uniref:DUF418 domain-containing protein n=1 Tax=Lewinella sp. LCG006 TaxID=3231911 RepID=UPI0034606E6D
MEKVSPPSRIVLIDALRGFALAGVALVHVTEQYLAGPQPPGFMEGLNSLPDEILMGFISFFIQGKFFALFSILFGLSFSIQMDGAERKGEDFSWRFLWRAILLLVIGYVHHLFYRGDILTIYAVLAPLLIPFHRLSKAWVLGAMAICFLSLPRFITYFLMGNEAFFGLPSDFQNPLETAYYETIKEGSLLQVFAANADYGMKAKMSFQLMPMGRLYYTFGYFLVGLWLGRIGLFQDAGSKLKTVKRAMLWCLGLFVVAAALTGLTFSQAPQPIDFNHILHVVGVNFFDWTNIALTGIILGGFILLYHKDWWLPKLAFFAPYGRMALTNYVFQSIIGTFLFFGWGLGWIGELRYLYLGLIAIILIALQVHFSKYWLRHYKYGPLEWLWRSATYWKWQPFRKE